MACIDSRVGASRDGQCRWNKRLREGVDGPYTISATEQVRSIVFRRSSILRDSRRRLGDVDHTVNDRRRIIVSNDRDSVGSFNG